MTNGVDYSWLVGLAVSGLVYLLLSRSLDIAAEQRSDRGQRARAQRQRALDDRSKRRRAAASQRDDRRPAGHCR